MEGAEDNFGDILQAKAIEEQDKDAENEKPTLQEIELHTGEEDERTIFQTRAKLFTMDEHLTWKERGTGQLKVNVRRIDGMGTRLVMRAEGVFRVILNVKLFKGMKCEYGPDPKFVKLAAFESGAVVQHAIKVGNGKLAQELFDTLMEGMPGDITDFFGERSEV